MKLLKSILPAILMAFMFVSCENKATETTDEASMDTIAGVYGQDVTVDGALGLAEVVAKMKSENLDSMPVKFKNNIDVCCQKKGCWMDMKAETGEEVKVTFLDYGFFVPLNSTGRESIVEGMMYKKVVPVDELKHYAEDKGASKEEIEKITEPKNELRVVANGVRIL